MLTNLIEENKDKNMFIYGLGKMTSDILAKYGGYRFSGILDGFRTEGMFENLPIVPLDSLSSKDDSMIIIAARKASERIIYKRIKDFCKIHNIPIYSASDGSIFECEVNVTSLEEIIRMDDKIINEIYQKLNYYEYISFDIFDTLLIRHISNRQEIYDMVAEVMHFPEKFSVLRIKEEIELSQNGCYDINAIYKQISKEVFMNSKTMKMAIEYEFFFEKLFAAPRKDFVDLFCRLKKDGKKIALISDMYFSQKYISKLLLEIGIDNYDELLISCDYGTNKYENLFDIYKKNKINKKCLHIGDSEEADGICVKYGIDFYLVKSVNGMPYPYGEYEFGNKIIGYVVAGILKWIYRKAKEKGLTKILFISRDGYLLQKVWSKLYTDIEGIYLYTSRSLCQVTTLYNKDDITLLASKPFSGTCYEMAKERFYIDDSIEINNINELISKYSSTILKKAERIRENYIEYLNSFNLLNEKLGIFDLASTGTCQYYLEKLLNKKLYGLYFQHIKLDECSNRNLFINGFLNEYSVLQLGDDYFKYELFLKAIEPSVKYVEDNGKIVFFASDVDFNQMKFIKKLQKGVIDLLDNIDSHVVNEYLAISLLKQLSKGNIIYKKCKLINYDVFMHRKIVCD